MANGLENRLIINPYQYTQESSFEPILATLVKEEVIDAEFADPEAEKRISKLRWANHQLTESYKTTSVMFLLSPFAMGLLNLLGRTWENPDFYERLLNHPCSCLVYGLLGVTLLKSSIIVGRAAYIKLRTDKYYV